MSRDLSATADTAINAAETGEVFLLLLAIDHVDLAQPIRVVANNEDVTSRGNLYVAYAFDITLPGDSSDQLPQVQLVIDNVDRSIVDAIRVTQGPPSVSLEVVMASSPDTVEAGPFDMTLKEVQYNALTVEGELFFEDVLNEPFPGHTYGPVDYPALF